VKGDEVSGEPQVGAAAAWDEEIERHGAEVEARFHVPRRAGRAGGVCDRTLDLHGMNRGIGPRRSPVQKQPISRYCARAWAALMPGDASLRRLW
jgi:hypothetical protein